MTDQQNPTPQTAAQPQPTPDGAQAANNLPVPDATPQLVYVTRPHEPLQPELSPEQLRRHEECKQKFPHLNLSKGEFVISAVHRHPIGLLQIWFAVVAALALLFLAVILLSSTTPTAESMQASTDMRMLLIPAGLVGTLVLLFGFIATSIYNGNQFYLTNESVIQLIQTGIFARKEQTVSLNNIEDASYNQHGILPHILNYGMLRLSTEGDETTYRFNYASRPQRQIALLNNAVEAFKNGRPVTGDDETQD